MYGKNHKDPNVYVSLFHSLIVLSFSRAADAMMFSVGWQAVQRTTSVWPCRRCTISLLCKFQMYTMLSSLPDTIHCKIKSVNKSMQRVVEQISYLSTGDWEVGKYTVFLVFVARVSLQAFALRVVPQLECIVECGSQDVFAIRREFNERHGWIVVINECF